MRTRHALLLASVAAAAVLAFACGAGDNNELGAGAPGPNGGGEGGGGGTVDLDGSVTPTGSVPGGAGTGANTGLPWTCGRVPIDVEKAGRSFRVSTSVSTIA
jgi:hypothetical protein